MRQFHRHGAALVPMLLVAVTVAACYGGFGLSLNETITAKPTMPAALVTLLGILLPNPHDLVMNLAKVTVVFFLAVMLISFGTK